MPLDKGSKLYDYNYDPRAQRPGENDESLQEDAALWRKTLHFINRGTAGSAAGIDELIFNSGGDDVNPIEAYLQGVFSKKGSKVQSFNQILSKAGWNPESTAGRIIKGVVGFGLDVGADPTTYLTGGLTAVGKGQLSAGKAIAKQIAKSGSKKATTGRKAGAAAFHAMKQAGESDVLLENAKFVLRNLRSSDKKTRDLAEKLISGEKMTKAEEAEAGLRKVIGFNKMGIFGHRLKSVGHNSAHAQIYKSASKMWNGLRESPFGSPVFDAGDALFVKWNNLRKKYPIIHKAREKMEESLGGLHGAAVRQGMVLKSKLEGDSGKHVLQAMERPTVDRTFDLEALLKKEPHMWNDLGWKPGKRLGARAAAELVDKYFQAQLKFSQEFGPSGILRNSTQQAKITEIDDMIEVNLKSLSDLRESGKGLAPDSREAFELAEDHIQGTLKRLEGEKEALIRQTHVDNPQLTKEVEAAYKDQILVDKSSMTRSFDQFDAIGFQDWVIKRPKDMDNLEAHFLQVIDEAKHYKMLNGLPGVGHSELVWKEVPLVRVRRPEKMKELLRIRDQLSKMEKDNLEFGVGEKTPFIHDPEAVQDATWDLIEQYGKIESELYDWHVPGFQIIPKAEAGSEGLGILNKHQREAFEQSDASFKNTGNLLDRVTDDRFIKGSPEGGWKIRIPALVKNRVKNVDEVATRRFHDGALGARQSRNIIMQANKLLARASQQGVSIGSIPREAFVITKDGRLNLYDLGEAAAHKKGPIATDAEVHEAWMGNLVGPWKNVVASSFRNEPSRMSFLGHMEDIELAMKGGGPAVNELPVAMDNLKIFLKKHKIPTTHMGFEEVMAKRLGFPAPLKRRVLNKLIKQGVKRADADKFISDAEEVIRQKRADEATIPRSLETIEGKLEEQVTVLEEIENKMLDLMTVGKGIDIETGLETGEKFNQAAYVKVRDELEGLYQKLEDLGPGELDLRVQDIEFDPTKNLPGQVQEALSSFREKRQKLINEREGISATRLATEDVLSAFSKKVKASNPIARGFTKEGRQALKLANHWNQHLEKQMIDSGLITHDTLTRFEEKTGLKHVRHWRTGDPKSQIKRFQDDIQQIDNKITSGAMKPRDIPGTIMEINELMGDKLFEDDLVKVMFMSHLEVGRVVENWNYVKQIAKSGFAADAPRVTIPNPEWKLSPDAPEFIKDVFEADLPGHRIVDHPLLKGKQLPEDLAKEVENVLGHLDKDNAFTKGLGKYRKLQNWWKKFSLFAWPSFFTRNYAGAIWNDFLHDVNPFDNTARQILGVPQSRFDMAKMLFNGKPSQLVDQMGTIAIDGHKKVRGFTNTTRQNLLDEFNSHNLGGSGAFGPRGEIERTSMLHYLELDSNPLFRALKILDPRTDKNTVIQLGMKFNQGLEDSIRFNHYIQKRRRGLSGEDAANSVRQAHFDYSDLTDLEKGTQSMPGLKDIFPFYTWTRKNVPLQFKMAMTNPGRFTAGGHAIQSIEMNTEGERPSDSIIPEWMNENLGVKVGFTKETGEYHYFLLGSWIPAVDLLRVMSPIKLATNMLSPLLKVPIESLTNKSLFFERGLRPQEELLSPQGGEFASKIPGAEQVDFLLKQSIGRVAGVTQSPLGCLRQDLWIRSCEDQGVQAIQPLQGIESTSERHQEST
jgi:hypothetical protein